MYPSSTSTLGMLVLRKADGTTGTWLDRSALSSNPTYENRYAIVNWKPLADRYYYEASFSTKGYYNIHIQSSMLLSFNGYSVQKLQYSLDGETYKDFGEINIVNPKVWYDDDSALPAEAENQEKIYVRWIPDYDSPDIRRYSDWRLPTRAELEVIVTYQDIGHSAIDEVLNSEYYWCSDGYFENTTNKETNAGIRIRCVRDVIPGDDEYVVPD